MGPEKPASPRSQEQLQSAMAECERRIDEARAIVLAKSDGVVTKHMTALEREWLTLARAKPAPPS